MHKLVHGSLSRGSISYLAPVWTSCQLNKLRFALALALHLDLMQAYGIDTLCAPAHWMSR
eukprot:365534-Chlamydomonas_euryale.AAC.19